MPEAPGTKHCDMTMDLADAAKMPVVKKPTSKIVEGPYQNYDPTVRIPLDTLSIDGDAKGKTQLV